MTILSLFRKPSIPVRHFPSKALSDAIMKWSAKSQSNVSVRNLIDQCDAIVRNQLAHIPDAESKVIDRIALGDHPLREAIYWVEKS